MPLNIDTSRALRSPQDLFMLVQAVLTASKNDESTWIEWKNGLKLREKEGRVDIARHILGMANRIPEDAVRHAEGCGYVVIGAEPGLCEGVNEIDPADLDAGLRPYLGSEGPRPSMQYIQQDGKSVLIITVDPPRRGDRMYTLQREYSNYRAGMIFVRRPGRTIQAEPGDIRALEQRYMAADSPITLHVKPNGNTDAVTISSIANYFQLFDSWRELKEADLFPGRYARMQGSGAKGVSEQGSSNLRIADDFLELAFLQNEGLDHNYQEEVDDYLAECREYFYKVAAARISSRTASAINLTLVNTSDKNYLEVQIKVRLPIRPMVGDPSMVEKLPEQPLEPSPKSRTRTIASSLDFPVSNFISREPRIALDKSRPKFTAKYEGNSITIVYNVDRIRPEDEVPLNPIFVLAFDVDASDLEATWRMTTSNVDGVVHGTFKVSVAEPFEAVTVIPELAPRKAGGTTPKSDGGFKA